MSIDKSIRKSIGDEKQRVAALLQPGRNICGIDQKIIKKPETLVTHKLQSK